MPLPILYSFRRCPYAMRARLALMVSNTKVELREVVLRDKPAEFLAVSASATVPALLDSDGSKLDESLDIMLWALERNDPDDWLKPEIGDKAAMLALIDEMDGPFKHHLDRYKYSNRYDEEIIQAEQHRDAALTILLGLDERLAHAPCLFGTHFSLADAAIAPFVRQYANTDAEWFAARTIPHVQNWLHDFVTSDLFLACMKKYPQWKSGEPGVDFPEINAQVSVSSPAHAFVQ